MGCTSRLVSRERLDVWAASEAAPAGWAVGTVPVARVVMVLGAAVAVVVVALLDVLVVAVVAGVVVVSGIFSHECRQVGYQMPALYHFT